VKNNPDSSDGAAITFRPVDDDSDREFLYQLYASTREDELAPVPWTEEEKANFLRQQFEAQTAHYNEHFREEADFLIILADGQPGGRLYLARREEEFRIIDIALLAEFRGRGIGGKLLTDIIAEATEAGKSVTIHVEQNNPAMRLYDRLGFRKIAEEGIYWLMERPCDPSVS